VIRKLFLSGALVAALTAPARSDEVFARFDVVLSGHILQLSTRLSESAALFQDWTKGRLGSAEAQARLKATLEVARKEQSQLKAAHPPSGLEALGSSAEHYARSQVAVIEGASRLVKAGPPDREALRQFLDQSLTGSRLNQTLWFEVRLKMMPRALSQPLLASLGAYYRWQAQWLPIWTEESKISSDIEHLLSGYSRANAEASSLQAVRLIHQALALRERAVAVKAGPGIGVLQQASLDELTAMAQVSNAVNSLLEDPSSDSVDRLHRQVGIVTQRSQQVEKLSLQALKARP